MLKKRIACCLLSTTLTTPLIQASSMQLNSETEQLTERVVDVDFKNYKFNEMQKKLDVEIQKIKAEQLRIQQEQERLAEEERLRQEELERQRIAEEERKRNENRIYCKFEVSFYTTAADEGSGTGIGASGEYVQPWVSIALPSDIPFYSTAYIEGLGTFIAHDTGSYIQWAYDEYGNLVCRVDVCVSTKEEAYSLGRFVADGYIDLNVEE